MSGHKTFMTLNASMAAKRTNPLEMLAKRVIGSINCVRFYVFVKIIILSMNIRSIFNDLYPRMSGETACGRRGSIRAPQHGEQSRSGSARGLGGWEKRSLNGTRSALGPMLGAYPSEVARSAARGPAEAGRARPTMYGYGQICTRQGQTTDPAVKSMIEI